MQMTRMCYYQLSDMQTVYFDVFSKSLEIKAHQHNVGRSAFGSCTYDISSIEQARRPTDSDSA